MMKATHVLAGAVVLAGAALVVVAVRADAPSDQYGFFQAMTPSIKDTKARLEWERFPELNLLAGDAGADGGMWAPNQTFANANTRCQNLGAGWRLPTVKELSTIVDEDPHQVYRDGGTPYLFIDRNAFPTADPQHYWSSSPAKNNQAWAVDFGSGEPVLDPQSLPNVSRCVRVY